MTSEAEPWPPEEDFYDRFQRLWRHSTANARQIANAVGLKNERTISNWSEPGRVPEAETLFALADYFGVSSRWLLTGKGDPEGRRPEHAKGAVVTVPSEEPRPVPLTKRSKPAPKGAQPISARRSGGAK